ncbi:two-component regulator propeller domain-containing protein [Chitinophaga sp. Hz27]|uniref:hybrid sensor histidine kinase/response regulator transcription factor n=1 Tax=Chitinophaga sp. Hz27 TaxID=3347169 RepID=UPI0035DC1B7C
MNLNRGAFLNLSTKTAVNSNFSTILAVVLLLLLPLFSRSQQQNLKFHHINTEKGLSQNSVLAITQDKEGFLWFGTQSGLNRYDGNNMKVFNSRDKNGLSHGYILSLLCDHNNQLWIGTGQGLNKFDKVTQTFASYLPKTNKWDNANVITSIAESPKALWIGTKDGLFKFLPSLKSFEKVNLDNALPNQERLIIYDIWPAQNGDLWVASSGGILILDIHTSQTQIKKIQQHFSPTNNEISATAITEYPKGNFWVGTQNNGMLLCDSSGAITRSFTAANNPGFVSDHIRKVIVDSVRNKVLVATQNGLVIINASDKSITPCQHFSRNPQSIEKNSLWSLYLATDGSYWIGSYFGGVSVSDGDHSAFNTWPGTEMYPGIGNPVISGMTKDKNGQLWICTEGNGLIQLDPRSLQYKVYRNSQAANSISSDLLKCIFLDKEGQLWIGSHSGGLNMLNTARNSFSHYALYQNLQTERANEIYAISETNNGKLLVGGKHGLFAITKGSNEFETKNFLQLLRPSTNALFQLNTTQHLAGTQEGLYLIENNQATRLFDGLAINCILPQSNEIIWLGTKAGLYTYNLKSRRLLKSNIKALDISILSISTDPRKNLWLSTENGLFMLTPDNSIHHYLASDGLANNQFNYNSVITDNEGRIFFGGNDGLTYFHPADIKINTSISPLMFTGITMLDSAANNMTAQLTTDLNHTDHITLNNKQASFSLQFALLNYIKSEKNQYVYQLEGFDKNPRTTLFPTAAYINLPPGDYTFTVKGINNDNIESAVKHLHITVLPPLWRTWWAYTIYALLIFALIFSTIRYIFLQLILKKEEYLHQQKLDFFTNISHEIRTHLTLIVAPVSNLMHQKEMPPANKAALIQVEANASRLMQLVNELMDFRKIERGYMHLHIASYEINSFLDDIYKAFLPVAESRNISLTFTPLKKDIQLFFDKHQLEKVCFNLISNAFKFTPDSGHICIKLFADEEQCRIEIADNGFGIDDDYKDKIFENYYQINDHTRQNTGYGIGLALSRKIVELHNGSLFLSDKTSEYSTVFHIVLKQGTEHFQGDHVHFDGKPGSLGITPQVLLQPEINTSSDQEEITDKNRKTVLVVEDNLLIQELIKGILSPFYQVTIASNAESGLVIAQEILPDIVISDVMMPGMNGFKFCQLLKSDTLTAHIPIILLTAKTSTDDQIYGLDQGADIYLSKPFNSRILLLHVRNLVRNQENIQHKIAAHYLNNKTTDIPETSAAEAESIAASGLSETDQRFLERLVNHVDEYIADAELGVQALTKEFAMSAPVLYKKIYAVTGLSIHEFIKIQRLRKACVLLKDKEMNISEVAYSVGYNDRKYFSKEFKKFFGINPTEYLKQTTTE